MLDALVPEESGWFNRFGYDYRSAVLIAAQDCSAEAMNYSYEPFPINEEWSEEYKDEYNRKIESRTAPGKCMIPRAVAERILSDAATRVFERDAADMVDYLKTEIAYCEGFVCADMDAVRAEQKRYNEINNEGGEGYIPPYCTQESIDTLKKRLAFWERYI